MQESATFAKPHFDARRSPQDFGQAFKEQRSKLVSSFIKLYFEFIYIVVLSRLQHFFSWGKCFFLSQSRTWRPSAGTFIKD